MADELTDEEMLAILDFMDTKEVTKCAPDESAYEYKYDPDTDKIATYFNGERQTKASWALRLNAKRKQFSYHNQLKRLKRDERQKKSGPMLESGMTTIEVAAALGCHYSTISNDAKALGIDIKKNRIRGSQANARRGRVNDGRIAEVYEHGLSLTELSRRCGLSRKTIGHRLKKLGFRDMDEETLLREIELVKADAEKCNYRLSVMLNRDTRGEEAIEESMYHRILSQLTPKWKSMQEVADGAEINVNEEKKFARHIGELLHDKRIACRTDAKTLKSYYRLVI